MLVLDDLDSAESNYATEEGGELPWWSQQSSWLTLCSHAQASSSSPCSCSAPSCPSSTSPKGTCESWQASRYYKPHLDKQHSTPRTQQRRSLWTQIRITFCLYICLQKRTRGILRNGSSLFKCKTRTLFPSSLHRHSLPEQDTG